jgi:hypothetical protein
VSQIVSHCQMDAELSGILTSNTRSLYVVIEFPKISLWQAVSTRDQC